MVSFTYPDPPFLFEPDKYLRNDLLRVGFSLFSNMILD